jgi:hypothetical protein
MAWEGKSPGEICTQLKDRNRNGGRDLALLHEHLAKDDLIAWAWNPGLGREPVPGTQARLGELIQAWNTPAPSVPEPARRVSGHQLLLACNKEFRSLPALAGKDMPVEVCVVRIRLRPVKTHLFAAGRALRRLRRRVGHGWINGNLRQDALPYCCQAGALEHSHTGSLWS